MHKSHPFLPKSLDAKSGTTACPLRYTGLFGFPGADTLGNMFQFLRDFEDYCCGVRDPHFARSLNRSLQSFKMWLTQNKSAIPLEAAA